MKVVDNVCIWLYVKLGYYWNCLLKVVGITPVSEMEDETEVEV